MDGDDGKTYIANLTAYGHVSIMRGDMQIQHEAIFETDPHYAEAVALFAETKPSAAPDAVMSAMETETDPLPDAVASAWDTELNEEAQAIQQIADNMALASQIAKEGRRAKKRP